MTGILLSSLPLELLLIVAARLSPDDRISLSLTNKQMRMAMLQHAPRLALHVGSLGSHSSYREARKVISKGVPLEQLTLVITWDAFGKAQQLLSQLAAQSTAAAVWGKHLRPISLLVIRCDTGLTMWCGGWANLLSPAFPGLTTLTLRILEPGDSDSTKPTVRRACRAPPPDAEFHPTSVTPEQLRSWLPTITDLTVHECNTQWVTALAPQLTRLVVKRSGNGNTATEAALLKALNLCTQLKAVEMDVCQLVLQTLLRLPRLARVRCTRWKADAQGQTCTWDFLSIGLGTYVSATTLPRGSYTLGLEDLTIVTPTTPEACLQQAQAQVRAITEAQREVSSSGVDTAFLRLITQSPRSPADDQRPACVAATLEGLAPLLPHLPTLVLRSVSRISAVNYSKAIAQFDSTLLLPVSDACAHLVRLRVECVTITHDVWAALPTALPCLRELQAQVCVLPRASLEALEALCSDPNAARGALLQIRVEMVFADYGAPERLESQTALQHLAAQLKAQGAPLQLAIVPWMN